MNTYTNISNAMFFIAYLIGTGGLLALYAAWTVRETSAFHRQVVTQRKRYTLLLMSMLVSAGTGYTLLFSYGWSDYVHAVNLYMPVGDYGFMVGVSMWYALLSPLVGLIVAIHIYRKPSLLAMRVKGGWIATSHVRDGLSNLPIYTFEHQVVAGVPVKNIVPTGRYIKY